MRTGAARVSRRRNRPNPVMPGSWRAPAGPWSLRRAGTSCPAIDPATSVWRWSTRNTSVRTVHESLTAEHARDAPVVLRQQVQVALLQPAVLADVVQRRHGGRDRHRVPAVAELRGLADQLRALLQDTGHVRLFFERACARAYPPEQRRAIGTAAIAYGADALLPRFLREHGELRVAEVEEQLLRECQYRAVDRALGRDVQTGSLGRRLGGNRLALGDEQRLLFPDLRHLLREPVKRHPDRAPPQDLQETAEPREPLALRFGFRLECLEQRPAFGELLLD